MGLKEILAAKKAAAESKVEEPKVLETPRVFAPEASPAPVVERTVETPKVEEPATSAAPKALTFAERMALKKAPATAATIVSQSPIASPEIKDTAEGKVTPSPAVPAATVSEDTPVSTPVSVGTTTVSISQGDSNDLEAEQAYADIKARIDTLESLQDTELSPQMSELKKALMKNPAAVSLMLDTDIGKMVVALRRITKEAVVEASVEKKPGRKPKADKAMPVDADMIAKVFDEL